MKHRGSILVSAIYALIAIVILGLAGLSLLRDNSAREAPVNATAIASSAPAKTATSKTDNSDRDPDEPIESEPEEPSLSRLEQTAVTQIGELIELVGESNGKLYEKLGAYDGGNGMGGLVWKGYRGTDGENEYETRCVRVCWLDDSNKLKGFLWESVEAGTLHDPIWLHQFYHPSVKTLVDNLKLTISGVYTQTVPGYGSQRTMYKVGFDCRTPEGREVLLHGFARNEPYEVKMDLRTNTKVPGDIKPQELNNIWVFAALCGETKEAYRLSVRDWAKIGMERDK